MVPHTVQLVQLDGRVILLDGAVQILSLSELAFSLQLTSLLCVYLLQDSGAPTESMKSLNR